MSFVQFLRVLTRNLKWLIIFPILIAILVYFLTGKLPREYESGSTVYTGIASGYGITSGDEAPRADFFSINNAFVSSFEGITK